MAGHAEGRVQPAPPAEGLHVVIGAGPIGLGIAEVLAAAGRSVRIVTRSGEISGQPPAVGTAQADASDVSALTRACKDAAVVYFAAAPPYQHWAEALPAMQEGAIRAAAETGAVMVAAENLYGYGSAGTLTEAHPLEPNSRKGEVRARMSMRLFEAHQSGEIRAVSGRASDFFGPGVRQSQLGEQVWPNVLKGRAVWWLGDPDATHTFTYAPDFARALVRLGAEAAAWGRAWHVPSPPDLTLRRVLTRAASIAGVKAQTVHRIPKLVLRAAGLIVPIAGELPKSLISLTTRSSWTGTTTAPPSTLRQRNGTSLCALRSIGGSTRSDLSQETQVTSIRLPGGPTPTGARPACCACAPSRAEARTDAVSSGPRAVSWRIGTG